MKQPGARQRELERKTTVLRAQIEAERSALLQDAHRLAVPLRRMDQINQGLRHVGQGLRRTPSRPVLLAALVPIGLLLWRGRTALQSGLRVWGVLRLVRALRHWRDPRVAPELRALGRDLIFRRTSWPTLALNALMHHWRNRRHRT